MKNLLLASLFLLPVLAQANVSEANCIPKQEKVSALKTNDKDAEQNQVENKNERLPHYRENMMNGSANK